MQVQFWSIGKQHESYVKEGIEMFTKRLQHYFPVKWHIIPMPRNAGMLSEMDLIIKEGEMLLAFLKKEDYLIVLEESGNQMNSEALAAFIQNRANDSVKNIIFLIGGAFGLSEPVLKRANYQWSLSKLVFPHQLVRLIICEQVYRACTILKNEKYHHA